MLIQVDPGNVVLLGVARVVANEKTNRSAIEPKSRSKLDHELEAMHDPSFSARA